MTDIDCMDTRRQKYQIETDSPILEKIYIMQPITENNEKNACDLIEEAKSLIESAGAAVAGVTTQKLRSISPATVFGSGKLAEIAEILNGLDVTILFNGDLTPSQTQNISSALGNRKVIDRTTLILDIFARNAKTAEGKLQVELAQLKYLYPRLKGKGGALSRLGGGVGTRGPGETRLETDRRYIRGRIDYLEKRLAELETRRQLQTARRKKTQTKTIALVGYTNAGKSTLLNYFCNENVYAENRLFATLDATARKFTIDGAAYLLVDTVGFLRDLPHHLIDAFRSTLESVLNADLVIIVCDATADFDVQLKTTLDVLHSLHFSSPYLLAINKSETIDENARAFYPADCIFISAKTGAGTDELKRRISEVFKEKYIECTLLVPYTQLKQYSKSKNYATERKSEYTETGVRIDCSIEKSHIGAFESWLCPKISPHTEDTKI